jgi:hypothetical protein
MNRAAQRFLIYQGGGAGHQTFFKLFAPIWLDGV